MGILTVGGHWLTNYGDIEYCDHCHRAKRVQFLLQSKGGVIFRYCSADCLKDHVAVVLFGENPDWAKYEWVPTEIVSGSKSK